MQTFISKYWTFLTLVISVILDAQTGLIEHLVKDEFRVKMIYLFGTLVYGYFFTSQYNQNKINRRKTTPKKG